MSNKEKRLAKNSVYNVVYKAIAALYAFFSICYVPQVLTSSNLGKTNYVFAIAFFFQQLSALGIPGYGVKCIAQAKTEKEKEMVFNELFKINLISTTVFLLIYFVCINTVLYSESHYKLMVIMTIAIILNYFNTDFYFQGIQRYDYLSIRSGIIKIIEIVLLLLFVRDENDYYRYAILLCANGAIDYLVNIIQLRKKINRNVLKAKVSKHLRPVIILCISILAVEIYTTVDTLMLEAFYGDKYVGYYSVGVKLVRYIYIIIMAFVTPFIPYIHEQVKDKNRNKLNNIINIGFSIILFISIPTIVLIISTANWLVPIIFGQTYLPTIDILYIISLLIIVFSVASFLGRPVLISTGNEKRVLISSLCGVLINVFLNYLLIPNYAHIGACISSVVAESIVTFILINKSSKFLDILISKKEILKIILSTFVMLLSILLCKYMCDQTLLSLVSIVVIALIVYFVMAIVLKEECIANIMKAIKNSK